MRTIAVDAMGGDHGVSTIVEGCAQASISEEPTDSGGG